MKYLHRLFAVAAAAFFIAGPALGQNAGTVTNHAFPIGKGAGVAGYTSLLCGAGTIPIGQVGADPICQSISGDITIGAGGVAAIGATVVHSAMLNADVFSTARSWGGPQTFVNPIVGTQTPGDNSTKAASTAYADAIAVLKANIASPTFTGIPAAPTAAVDTNTTQIATTAYVIGQAASASPLADAAAAVGTSTRFARADHVHPFPAMTGDVTSTLGAVATTIAASAVTNAKRANMTANTVSGNATGGAAAPTDVAPATARSSSLLNIDQMTTHGDSIYTILATDRVVVTSASFTASRTWTLPAANAINAGQSIMVADLVGGVSATNTLVISRAGADTINGGTTVTLSSANGAYLLISDGVSKWTAQAQGAAASSGVPSVGGVSGAIGVTNGLDMTGSNIELTAARRTLPTTSVVTGSSHTGGFAANGSGTYTTPANVLWIEIYMVGGGGGGGGSGATAATASNAVATCWNTSGAACTTPVYSAGGGGGGGGNGNAAGAGGTVSGSGTFTWSVAGASGSGGTTAISGSTGGVGGTGGSSFYGGAGGGAAPNVAGGSAASNSGSGAGGAGLISTVSQNAGSGGGAGAVGYVAINTPAATYTYSVGTGTSGGTAGTSGQGGGTGAGGQIVVIEHYGS